MAVKKSQNPASGMLATISEMWAKEGWTSFYKGWRPNVLRIGSYNIILWMSYEQIRKI